MILTVEALRKHIETDETDDVLEEKLRAMELLIRAYTNNNFQQRAARREADVVGGFLYMEALQPFDVGDTLQISDSELNDGLYTVTEADDATVTLKEKTYDERDVLVTRVIYPADIKMGVVNMMKWELNNREKVGISSETISRHSVSYFDLSGDNSIAGFPKALLGFLKPYMKARFGQGVRV
nr:MAG TPA: head to tail adaptor [Caudoviricetes sp.]